MHWLDRVGLWWNYWAEMYHRGPGGLAVNHIHKSPALYLWGKAGSTKSMTIKSIVDKYDKCGQLFIMNGASTAKFSYSNFNPKIHRVTWIEEFTEGKGIDMNELKKFVAGETFHLESKNRDAKTAVNKFPVIFTSQHAPPLDDAFSPDSGKRLFIVCCNSSNNQLEFEEKKMNYFKGEDSSIHMLKCKKVDDNVYQKFEHIQWNSYENLKLERKKDFDSYPILPYRDTFLTNSTVSLSKQLDESQTSCNSSSHLDDEETLSQKLETMSTSAIQCKRSYNGENLFYVISTSCITVAGNKTPTLQEYLNSSSQQYTNNVTSGTSSPSCSSLNNFVESSIVSDRSEDYKTNPDSKDLPVAAKQKNNVIQSQSRKIISNQLPLS